LTTPVETQRPDLSFANARSARYAANVSTARCSGRILRVAARNCLLTILPQVWKAFRAQVAHLAQHALIQQHVALRIKPQYFAAPATSMFHDLAMADCRDLHSHGDYTARTCAQWSASAWPNFRRNMPPRHESELGTTARTP
jgi:hypothetical protein